MRVVPSILAIGLLLSGCTLPGLPTTSTAVAQADQEGVIGSTTLAGARRGPLPQGNLSVTGGGLLGGSGSGSGVIAAGGGNVIAAGGGNVVAAGGGNLGAAPAAAPQTGGLTGLIAVGSAQVVAAGGMNLTPPRDNPGNMNPDTMTPGAMNPGTMTPDMPETGAPEEPGTLNGKVLAPGSLVGQPDQLLPLGQAYVGVYDMAGNPVGQPVQTAADGTFSLPAVPSHRMLAVRTEFTYNDKTYYLGAIFRLEGGTATVNLTPLATLAEARFFERCAGTAPADDFMSETYLDAFREATKGFEAEVPGTAILANASRTDRSMAYGAVKAQHPDAFKNDIDAVFDKTNTSDATGPTGGGTGLIAEGGLELL